MGTRKRIRPGVGTDAVLRGEDDVTTWDNEELRRGHRRARDGTFRGRPPKIVPRAVYDELRRRTATEFAMMVQTELVPAMQVIVDMAKGDIAADPTQLKAAQEIVNRFAGKAPERVDITHHGERPYEAALRGGIVRDIADPEDEDVIDAEVVEDDA